MAGLSLREAARETGRSKGAILRAIQAGGLSAARTDDGSWSIEPSELSRIYELKPGVAVQVTEKERVGQGTLTKPPFASPNWSQRSRPCKRPLQPSANVAQKIASG